MTSMMKRMCVTAAVVVVLPLLLSGCGDDESDGEEITLAQVASDWTAISVEYESDFDPNERVDVINDLNGTFDLTIDEDGDYVTSINLPGQGIEIDAGTVSVVNGDQLRFDPDDDAPETADARLSNGGNRLTLEFDNAEYDFDGNGSEEEANARMILVRL
jgi:hypothetical protein